MRRVRFYDGKSRQEWMNYPSSVTDEEIEADYQEWLGGDADPEAKP